MAKKFITLKLYSAPTKFNESSTTEEGSRIKPLIIK